MPRLAELAKPLATKAAEFLTSMRLSAALAVVALVAILDFQLTAMLTLDIAKGGEL